jgi:hypothetical protein
LTDALATSYIELGLRVGRHVDGLVDSYYGPADLRERVGSEELREPQALLADTNELLEELETAGFEEQRTRWLRAQLVALETVCRRLAGEDVPYQEEVERCYGVRTEHTPEEVFERAHRELDELLPGPGSLAERHQVWRERNVITDEALGPVVDGMLADVRARTQELFGLPEGEDVEIEYVSNEPWSGYNYYLGDLRSRVAINVDRPISPDFVAELVPHEAYPGHHTEHVWKEQLLVREGGQAEESIVLAATPQNLVAEGIAGLGPDILLGEEEESVTQEHVAGSGVDYDPVVSRAVKQARLPLGRVQTNVALMLHADGASRDEARDYLVRWNLASEERAVSQLEFLGHPLWRAYVPTYVEGYYLCRDFVGGDPARFKRLLTEQLTPADLVTVP